MSVLYGAISPRHVHWDQLGKQLPAIMQAALLGPVLNVPINLLALANITGKSCNSNNEMIYSSISQGLTGVFGGFTCHIAVADTKLHMLCGGLTRWSTMLSGVVILVFMLFPWLFEIVRIIPRVVLAGKFVDLGVFFLVNAALTYKTLKKKEYINIWVMVVVSIIFNITTALVVGLGISFVFFVTEASRVENLDIETDAAIYRSNFVRTLRSSTMLSVPGRSCKVIKLRGHLYFATASRLRRRSARGGDDRTPTSALDGPAEVHRARLHARDGDGLEFGVDHARDHRRAQEGRWVRGCVSHWSRAVGERVILGTGRRLGRCER